MMTIAILLTCYNRREKTLACLNNLFRQEAIGNEYSADVFMVDDGSTDGTGVAIREAFPSVTIIQGTGALFWNRGMHLAWETASANSNNYDFYLWLNDDTFLNKDAIKKMLHTSSLFQHQAIIVGTTCAKSDQTRLTYGGRSKGGQLIRPGDRPIPCSFFNGNIVLVPAFVHNKVGKNDPLFRHALGDFDYGLRAERLGIKSFVAPGVVGSCDSNDKLPAWCNPSKKMGERWRAFRTPLGHNPEEFFIFERRHKNVFFAVYHYMTNHLRVFCPWIWQRK